MSEETKEILEHLSATQKINNGWTSFSDKECKLLYYYITNLQEEIQRLNYKLQQKENIIKEVREYINWRLEEHQDMDKYQMEELLEILDKVD